MSAIVYLVGAGPGDPELLTLKALRLLRAADAIVHDQLVSSEILALARPDAEKIFVGKKPGAFCCPQRDIEGTLIRLAREGKHVVRLKGGDPFVFGRGGEEAEALAEAGIAFEIVPGVTSALGAASYAGIPLTHREHSSAVVFLTGHEDPKKPDSAIRWEDYGRLGATLCIYMGMKNLETITRRLQTGGLAPATPAAVIQSATTGAHRQIISTVEKIALESEHAGFGAPAIVIIGEVVRLAGKLAWFESRAGFSPPSGSLTRPRGRAEARPTLMIVALIDNGSLEPAAVRNLRAVAAGALSERVGVPVEAVSWKHSDRVPIRALLGAATPSVAAPIKARKDAPASAWTLAPWMHAQVARGEREFLFVPFFVSAQGAIGSALREDLEQLSAELGEFLFAFTDGLAARGALAGIVAARVRETLAAKKLLRPAVIVVDHGGPSANSAALRDAVANAAGRSLLAGDSDGAVHSIACKQAPTSVVAASMEGRHGPLFADALVATDGDVIVAPLFLSPGRHAGPDGDLARIARTTAARVHFTALVGSHPAVVEALAAALHDALAATANPLSA